MISLIFTRLQMFIFPHPVTWSEYDWHASFYSSSHTSVWEALQSRSWVRSPDLYLEWRVSDGLPNKRAAPSSGPVACAWCKRSGVSAALNEDLSMWCWRYSSCMNVCAARSLWLTQTESRREGKRESACGGHWEKTQPFQIHTSLEAH